MVIPRFLPSNINAIFYRSIKTVLQRLNLTLNYKELDRNPYGLVSTTGP